MKLYKKVSTKIFSGEIFSPIFLKRAYMYYIKDRLITQVILSSISLLVLFFNPKFFSSITRLAYKGDIQKLVPALNERIVPMKNPIDEFEIVVNGIKKLDEVNIIMRGSSFNIFGDCIDYSLPTFYLNYYEGEIVESKSPIFITADRRIYNIIKKNKKDDPVIFISPFDHMKSDQPHKGNHEIFNNFDLSVFCKHVCGGLELGSGLAAISVIKSVSNKVNIYGWDSYLDKDVSNMRFKQYLLYLFSTPSKPQYRRLKLISEKMLNFIYAKRFSDCKDIKINSYFSNINFNKEIYRKLKDIMYI
jgi:hypothetical protein